jgi:ADP-heptose:LPS heptosyltransferase
LLDHVPLQVFLMRSEDILIVRPGALGDTILTIPLIHTVRKLWSHARIVFLGSRRYTDLLPPDVVCQDFEATAWLWLFAGQDQELESSVQSYDRAFVILTRPERVMRNLLQAGTMNVLHASPAPHARTPMVVHLHQGLNLPVPPPRPCLAGSVREVRDDTLWVHPGSGGPSKCIPLPLLADLVLQVRGSTGYRVIVSMTSEDAFLIRAPGWDALVNDPGTLLLKDLSLKELCRQVGSPRLFLGNDSGISHLAAALGVPAVVFFVRTDPSIWAPWTDPASLLVMDLRDRDLTAIDSQSMASAIRSFLMT